MDSNIAIMALITGALLPFVTGFLTKAAWPEWGKFIAVVILAAAIGAVELQLTGQLDGITWANAYGYLGAIYVASGAVFWTLISQTGLKGWLDAHGVK